MLHYCVIGAGGTGGSIAAYLARGGKKVSVVVRGEHGRRIREQGIRMETTRFGTFTVSPVECWEPLSREINDHAGSADVIFVCVKGYSLEETLPTIRELAHKDTVVIPILNIYGTGTRLQEQLPRLLVTDGCIYIAAEIGAPGVILQKGDIFRVVFGVRKPQEFRPVLREIDRDLRDSAITSVLSENIQRDTLMKFSCISPMAACGLFYQCRAGVMQQNGEQRDTYITLIREISAIADANGLSFEKDPVTENLQILDALQPDACASMLRDVWSGKPSEIDGLVFEPVRMGRACGVGVPTYEKIAAQFGFTL